MNKYITAGLYSIGVISGFGAGICADRLYKDWQERKRAREIKKHAEKMLEELDLTIEEQTSEQ